MLFLLLLATLTCAAQQPAQVAAVVRHESARIPLKNGEFVLASPCVEITLVEDVSTTCEPIYVIKKYYGCNSQNLLTAAQTYTKKQLYDLLKYAGLAWLGQAVSTAALNSALQSKSWAHQSSGMALKLTSDVVSLTFIYGAFNALSSAYDQRTLLVPSEVPDMVKQATEEQYNVWYLVRG